MQPKAFTYLGELPDKDFFQQISLGYEQIVKHAISLDDGAQILGQQANVKGNRVLSLISEEESAKCLILMDAVRCPRNKLANHLKKMYNHLAKAIYSEACYVTPNDNNFAGLEEYVKSEQKKYYIDGENHFDWIWRNRLVAKREEAFYVDYVETYEGNHLWLLPLDSEFYIEKGSLALLLAKALYETGCTSAASLQVIAEFWREIAIGSTLTLSELRKLNIQTLDNLNKQDLLQEQPQNTFRIIIDSWMFPMYSLDMIMDKEDNKENLRNELENNENDI